MIKFGLPAANRTTSSKLVVTAIERVRLPAPFRQQLHMGEFPSGQRGQTVNLLRFASMVRIRPPPPRKTAIRQDGGFLWWKKGWWIRTYFNATLRWSVARRAGSRRHLNFLPPQAEENANRIRPPSPEKHQAVGVIFLTENCIKQLAGHIGLSASIYRGLGNCPVSASGGQPDALLATGRGK